MELVAEVSVVVIGAVLAAGVLAVARLARTAKLWFESTDDRLGGLERRLNGGPGSLSEEMHDSHAESMAGIAALSNELATVEAHATRIARLEGQVGVLLDLRSHPGTKPSI